MQTPSSLAIIEWPKWFENCKEPSPAYYAACEEFITNICKYYNYYGVWSQPTLQYNTDAWFLILQYMGGLASFAFFLVVWNTPELQVHPMKLLMYTALFEGISQIALAMQFYVCEFDLHKLFARVFFLQNDIYWEAHSAYILG